jgi:hypothetical protein
VDNVTTTELKPIPHGEHRGYLQHIKRGVEPCQSCRDAQAA